MRKFAALTAALATSVALAVPAFVGPADASAHRADHRAASHSVDRKKAPKLKVKRAKKGVQPGLTGEKITALPGKKARGKVKFVLKGTGVTLKHKAKIKKGHAVYKVPPLGTGSYKVKVSYKNRKGKTKFEVYDSAITLSRTSLTVSKSDIYVYSNGGLTGSVKYKGKAATKGYFDVYKDGNLKGGESSPDFLGFAPMDSNGTFNYAGFGEEIADKYPAGTYNFQGFYTPTPSFSDYVSSNVITVTVTN